jgi:pantoate--beta-alanine ligase
MIKVFKTRESFELFRADLKTDSNIGLVPTMGNLHAGHISLLKQSTEENDFTILTIFVNPKQFAPNEDFNQYPRTLDLDLDKVAKLEGKNEIVVFAPESDKEIYPENYSTTISVGPITQILCGTSRPTHFDGVTTVVNRLFSITKPTNVYFGQKDFQQCVIIKKMIKELELPIKMHILPIIRGAEGLALSSRNQYLTDDQRSQALHLPVTLITIEKLLSDKKSKPKEFIEKELKNKEWDYLTILDATNLSEPKVDTKEVVILGAYRMGKTRLLDNRMVTLNA